MIIIILKSWLFIYTVCLLKWFFPHREKALIYIFTWSLAFWVFSIRGYSVMLLHGLLDSSIHLVVYLCVLKISTDSLSQWITLSEDYFETHWSIFGNMNLAKYFLLQSLTSFFILNWCSRTRSYLNLIEALFPFSSVVATVEISRRPSHGKNVNTRNPNHRCRKWNLRNMGNTGTNIYQNWCTNVITYNSISRSTTGWDDIR